MGAAAIDLSATIGFYEDRWCEPEVSFIVQPDAEISVCHLVLWLKCESTDRSHFIVDVDGLIIFDFDAPHGKLVNVSFPCHVRPRALATIGLSCDNVVVEKGRDARELAFMLVSVGYF